MAQKIYCVIFTIFVYQTFLLPFYIVVVKVTLTTKYLDDQNNNERTRQKIIFF